MLGIPVVCALSPTQYLRAGPPALPLCQGNLAHHSRLDAHFRGKRSHGHPGGQESPAGEPDAHPTLPEGFNNTILG